jgi:hypothetical protein
MKTALLLLTLASLGLVGCSTTDQSSRGGTGTSFATDTTFGRSQGYENDLTSRDPRGAWENWRFGGDSNRIQPRLPENPNNPPFPTPVIPVSPMPANPRQ